MAKAGDVWRHSKTGNLYTVLHVGIYCGRWDAEEDPSDWRAALPLTHKGFPEGTELVIYVGHYVNPKGNRIYVRPLSEWHEDIEVKDGPGVLKRPRFVLVDM